MMMMRLRDIPSNQFSSLEMNVSQKKVLEADEGEGYRDAALVFFLSFLLAFLILSSVFLTLLRIIQCVKKLRSTPDMEKYLVEGHTMEWGEGV